jgi:transposase
MRQRHVAGDKLFVDYSGKRLGICNPVTGEIRMAEIFVAVLGASNYTFAEVTGSQTLPDWIGSHVRLFRHIGGVPRLLVPDNLKSGAQSYIIGRLRNQTFFSLDEANTAIAEVMTRMNTRPMRKLGVSRVDLLESLDRPALRALPPTDYEYAEWRLVRTGVDYHVEIESFYYSVPHALIREQVDARITTRMIELFHRGKRPNNKLGPLISGAMAASRVTARLPSICRAPIASMPSGRPSAFVVGAPTSGPTPRA